MINENIINKYAKCCIYNNDTEGYEELNEMSDFDLSILSIELEKLGFFFSYNLTDDCFCIV